MLDTVWTAVVCGMVGVPVGLILPEAGLTFAQGWCGLTSVRSSHRRLRKRTLSSVVATSSIMAWIGLRHPGPTLPAWCWMAATGVCLALVDIECRRLPRSLIAAMGFGGLLVFVTAAVEGARSDALVRAISAAGVVASIALGVALAAPGHVGGGDVTLYPVLALYLGWWGWPTLVFGMVVGAVLTAGWAIVLLFTGRAGRHSRFAAGPTLILGALVAIALQADTGTA